MEILNNKVIKLNDVSVPLTYGKLYKLIEDCIETYNASRKSECGHSQTMLDIMLHLVPGYAEAFRIETEESDIPEYLNGN